ncbi:Acyl-CoA-binding protein-like protein [Golovinomyces cichoracearum]|uniref:Acyl-CoA-binding protein-like protein n=1 Tax=Golovinomyces cichoracearum TaxID=62708 RepID=A0A420J4T2_9PEZI|nr:Acyl-CoA-binding protein-like protein [Golovinomyces cichoracearum]
MANEKLDQDFKTAATHSKQLTLKPNNDELLELYGLYKIATGEDINKAEAVKIFDLKEKSKRRAWQEQVDKNITPEEAKVKYIELVEKHKVTYKFDPSKVPETTRE